MKFSILTLFAATGYVALVIAGLMKPDSWWRYGGSLAWLTILAYVFALATESFDRGKAVFGRTALGCLTAYLVLTWLPYTLANGARRADILPHHWLTAWWEDSSPIVESAPYPTTEVSPPKGTYGPPKPPGYDTRVYGGNPLPVSQPRFQPPRTVETVLALNFALVFGLLGGTLALWRYRRQEHRTQ